MTDPGTVQQLQDIDAMFAQTAGGFAHAGDRIVLSDVSPSTLYFGDRPSRVVGHVSTEEFVALWGEGEDSFAIDPPNAVLSFLSAGARVPAEAVVTLTDPELAGAELSYAATVLDGELPTTGSGCSLFIDPFGRPLSPISFAGMRRRTRRRTRRRVALMGR
jgi:hypothetical protein